MTDATLAPKPSAHILRRLLALVYDALPAVALCMVIGAIFVVVLSATQHDERAYVHPWSLLNWLEWALCWIVVGVYAVLSWRGGGQTLGMRPWRLRVVAADGGKPTTRALVIRYAVGTLSLLAGGLGFWWAWIDRDKWTWHDRASRTVIRREAKR
jgi:uncharacterized RDD family membrane protein YckC